MDRKYDRFVGGIFAVGTIIIIFYFFINREFFEWAFDRHHNILSWYIRPLFVIPIVIGAYRKSFTLIFISIFSLFTSMFWFPKPDRIDTNVIKFLDFEKNYLMSGWSTDKIFVLIAVILFFIFLIYATWVRKLKLLLIVITVSPLLKILHSVLFSSNSGFSIVKPAVIGVVICIAVIVLFFKK
ncbi:MAG: hypothetical protein Q4D53_01870 [Leptotrichiaceae bacterium]|nr:hypothetical protein [Leptotrichiaceae bacterium]